MAMQDSRFSEEVRELAREKAEFVYGLMGSDSATINLPTPAELDYLGRLDFETYKFVVEQYGLTGNELETHLQEIEELRRTVMEDLRFSEPAREIATEKAQFVYSLIMDSEAETKKLPTPTDLDYVGRLDFEMHKFAVEQYGLTGDELETYLEELEEYAYLEVKKESAEKLAMDFY